MPWLQSSATLAGSVGEALRNVDVDCPWRSESTGRGSPQISAMGRTEGWRLRRMLEADAAFQRGVEKGCSPDSPRMKAQVTADEFMQTSKSRMSGTPG